MLPVFLIHYAAPEWIRSAAESIELSEPRVKLTVISNSGPVDVADADLVVTAQNVGYAGGANVAIERWLSDPESDAFVVIGSHDLHVRHDTFDRLRAAMVADAALGIVGPVMHDAARGNHLGATYYTWLSGQCLMIRRACARQLGGFDERFSSYVEDVDICLRAWDLGWKVAIVEGAEAHGLGSAITSSRELRGRRWANQVGLARKRGGAVGGLKALSAQLAYALGGFFAAVARPRSFRWHMSVARDRIVNVPAAVAAFRRFR